VLRLFKLNTGQDDHAVMFFDDYLKQVGLTIYMNVCMLSVWPNYC